MYEHPLHSEPEAHNTLVVNASQVHSFRRQLTSGAIQYGVPMVVLRLPSVFSTTAEIPRVRKEGRRKGWKKEGREEGEEEGRVESETCEYSHILLPMQFTSPSQVTLPANKLLPLPSSPTHPSSPDTLPYPPPHLTHLLLLTQHTPLSPPLHLTHSPKSMSFT